MGWPWQAEAAQRPCLAAEHAANQCYSNLQANVNLLQMQHLNTSPMQNTYHQRNT
jgi:hypothetical protein